MMMDEIFGRMKEKLPLAVMARAAMERALEPSALNELFDGVADRQYTRKLLFSSVAEVMSMVVCTRVSVRKAFLHHRESIDTSLQAVYDKIDNTEPEVSRALVRHVAGRLTPVIEATGGAREEWLPGYRIKILDGNHLAATQHRIAELRETSAGPLPGFGLVVLDPRLRMAIDVICEEDGHAQERKRTDDVLETVEKNDLWIDDRNFCTANLLAGIAARQGYFLTREHAGNAPCRILGEAREAGSVDTGTVSEQAIMLRGPFGEIRARRIIVWLEKATRDGERFVSILTNLPETISAQTCAGLYRKRWTIETAFQEMERVLGGEVATLGYPKAALLAFCIALTAYNVFAAIKAAIGGAHGVQKADEEVSNVYIGLDVAAGHHGLELLDDEYWARFSAMPPRKLAAWLVETAATLDMEYLQKTKRGPKKPKKKKPFDPKHPHVSTARLLAARRSRKSKK